MYKIYANWVHWVLEVFGRKYRTSGYQYLIKKNNRNDTSLFSSLPVCPILTPASRAGVVPNSAPLPAGPVLCPILHPCQQGRCCAEFCTPASRAGVMPNSDPCQQGRCYAQFWPLPAGPVLCRILHPCQIMHPLIEIATWLPNPNPTPNPNPSPTPTPKPTNTRGCIIWQGAEFGTTPDLCTGILGTCLCSLVQGAQTQWRDI